MRFAGSLLLIWVYKLWMAVIHLIEMVFHVGWWRVFLFVLFIRVARNIILPFRVASGMSSFFFARWLITVISCWSSSFPSFLLGLTLMLWWSSLVFLISLLIRVQILRIWRRFLLLFIVSFAPIILFFSLTSLIISLNSTHGTFCFVVIMFSFRFLLWVVFIGWFTILTLALRLWKFFLVLFVRVWRLLAISQAGVVLVIPAPVSMKRILLRELVSFLFGGASRIIILIIPVRIHHLSDRWIVWSTKGIATLRLILHVSSLTAVDRVLSHWPTATSWIFISQIIEFNLIFDITL